MSVINGFVIKSNKNSGMNQCFVYILDILPNTSLQKSVSLTSAMRAHIYNL